MTSITAAFTAGVPTPPRIHRHMARSQKEARKDGEDDDDEEEEGYREETPVDKIPHSHEVALSHGEKAITRYTTQLIRILLYD